MLLWVVVVDLSEFVVENTRFEVFVRRDVLEDLGHHH